MAAPLLFFSMAAFAVFATDVLKAWAARYLIRFLTPKILSRFKIISGLCLIGFGFRLFWFTMVQFK
jgi:uncharacterized membrane protein YqgA involved in biofilm formation